MSPHRRSSVLFRSVPRKFSGKVVDYLMFRNELFSFFKLFDFDVLSIEQLGLGVSVSSISPSDDVRPSSVSQTHSRQQSQEQKDDEILMNDDLAFYVLFQCLPKELQN